MPTRSTDPLANRGYLAALTSTLFLATTAIFIRYLTLNYQLPALILTFWRELFVACFLLIFFLVFKPALLRGARPHLSYLAAYGVVLAMFNGFWALSVAFNGAAVATVLVYSSAAFTAVLGWLILKEELGLAKVIAVILSLVGCALVANVLDPKLLALNAGGLLIGVFAGLAYAVYSLMGRSASQRGLNPWTTLFFIFGIASLFLLITNLVFGRFLPGGAAQPRDLFWLGNSLAGWGVLLTLAAVPTLLGFGLYNVSLKHLPSSVANLIMTSEPVFTAAIAYFMFGEMLTPIQIAGSALILAGVVLIRLTGK
ncbi:MAG: DMT family transporter [Anaerolineaceae bacterium]|jgi:drug/metabolite transporter (DMT)-like permease|nr:DMT family transporter [Anaerolineaceae bacterium]